jgi:hypothetical protein
MSYAEDENYDGYDLEVDAENDKAYAAGVAAERERCAKVCEERADKYGEGDGYSPSKESGCFECATAIRKGE